ncbi:MAG: hypothetical protein JWQ62_1471 [Lacunisphaera sp.]|nr:hypothetical protein [Lacunisphaera sp.]
MTDPLLSSLKPPGAAKGVKPGRPDLTAPPGRRSGSRILATLTLGLGLALAAHAEAPKRPSEIVVSAANYAQTPPDVLAKLFRHPVDLPDVPPPPPGTPPVRYYQFLPAERLEADLPYLEVCKLLSSALKAKNLLNTSDQAKVQFILRLTFGARSWRDPFVRENDLEWRQGLVPKKRGAAFGSTGAWDERAGGNESALYQLERDLVDMNPTGGAEGMADRLIGDKPTEDYYLIVVDAFDVATLRQKGNKTPRAWSTFIAVPRQKGVKFSEVAATMIAKAAPYFGETLPGKARFTDREGTVKLGDLKVIEENATIPKK